MRSFKDYLDQEFEKRSKDPKNWVDTPFGKARVFTTEESDRSMRDSLIRGALTAIDSYKNKTPKYIIGKMGVCFGPGVGYSGREGNAKILTEMVREGLIGIDGEGQLYIIK